MEVSKRTCGNKLCAFVEHASLSIGIVSSVPSIREITDTNNNTHAWAATGSVDGMPSHGSYAMLMVSLKRTGSTMGNTKRKGDEQNNEKYSSVIFRSGISRLEAGEKAAS